MTQKEMFAEILSRLDNQLNVSLLRETAETTDERRIRYAVDIAEMFAPKLGSAQQETLIVVCLNTKHVVTHHSVVFLGSLNESILHPREVFRLAITHAASCIVLVHNHPSGDPTPSREDIYSTKQIQEAGKVIDIPLLDHVIIGSEGRFVSLKESGRL